MRALGARWGLVARGGPWQHRFLASPCPRSRSFSGGQPPPLYAETWVKAVEENGSRSALVYDGNGPAVDYTFNELESRVNRLTRNLRAKHGVEPGDKIVTIAENRPELITLMLACQKLGCAFVPLASDLSKQDCRTIVDMYEPKLLISDQPERGEFLRPDGKGSWPTMTLTPYREAESELFKLEMQGSDEPAEVTVSHTDPGIIFSTSGSTGLPKGVVYSNAVVGVCGSLSKMAKAAGTVPFHSLEPGEGALLWVPIRGVGATLLAMAFLPDGVRMVMVEGKKKGISTAEDWAPLIEKYEVRSNILFGAAMHQMLQAFPDRKFPMVKEILYGGSCFPPTLVQKSMEQFDKATFKQTYAMTEVFPISELLPAFHKRASEASSEDMRRMASAGKQHPMGKVFLEDLSQELSGKPPPPEKKGVGQICAWSPLIMKGYYKNPAKTAEAIGPDGYMRTGDVGKIDEEGFIHVVGRVKELIPTHRGFNVAPRDIEETLYRHEKVGQAAVIGIPHPSGAGEMVVAWVTPKAGAAGLTPEALKDHCEAAGMPAWQFPELFQVSEAQLPVVGGKVAKKVLQSPTFVIMNLTDSIDKSVEKAKLSDDWFGLAREVFERIDGDGNHNLDITELRAVFHEHAEAMLARFDRPDDNDDVVDLGEWLSVIGRMEEQERSAWLLQVSSVLAAFERGQILKA